MFQCRDRLRWISTHCLPSRVPYFRISSSMSRSLPNILQAAFPSCSCSKDVFGPSGFAQKPLAAMLQGAPRRHGARPRSQSPFQTGRCRWCGQRPQTYLYCRCRPTPTVRALWEFSERTPQEAAHAQAEVKLRRRLHALRRITLQAWEMGDSGRYVSNGDEDLDTFGFPRFFVPCDKNGKPRPSSSSPFGQEDPRP